MLFYTLKSLVQKRSAALLGACASMVVLVGIALVLSGTLPLLPQWLTLSLNKATSSQGAAVVTLEGPKNSSGVFIPATFTWTAPPGVTSITLTLVGGGAAGGPGIACGGVNSTNAGGGAGGYVSGTYGVTPGVSYPVVIGVGGEGLTGGECTNLPVRVGSNSSFGGLVACGGGTTGTSCTPTPAAFSMGGSPRSAGYAVDGCAAGATGCGGVNGSGYGTGGTGGNGAAGGGYGGTGYFSLTYTPVDAWISASSTVVFSGDTSKISWDTSGASNCDINGTSVGASGSLYTVPLTATEAATPYTLTLSCNSGAIVKQTTVTAYPSNSVYLHACDTATGQSCTTGLPGEATVTSGQTATLDWSASNVLGCSLVPGIAAGSVSTASTTASARFISANSAYLSRTFGAPTSQNVYTFSTWAKRKTSYGLTSGISPQQTIFSAGTTHSFGFTATGSVQLVLGSVVRTSPGMYNDLNAWYHIVYAQNGASTTVYVNGSSVISSPTGNTNTAFNTAAAHQLGALNGATTLDGYLYDTYFIDGQVLKPADFATPDSTGYWRPKVYAGSYSGNNSFRLEYRDVTALGKDTSGKATPNSLVSNNFSVGDQVIDTPQNGFGSFLMKTGKWYWEVTSNGNILQGIVQYRFFGFPLEIRDFSTISMGSTASYRYDADAGKFEKSTNGNVTWADVDFNPVISGYFGAFPYVRSANTPPSPNVGWLNLGQGGLPGLSYYGDAGGMFKHGPPPGYKALSTQNMPTPAVPTPSQYFDVKSYTGTGAATLDVTPFNFVSDFLPDVVWIKNLLGVSVFTTLTNAQPAPLSSFLTYSSAASVDSSTNNFLSTYLANGFRVKSGSGNLNVNGRKYISYVWKRSSTTGFDVVNYNGTGAATLSVPHSLGTAPNAIIIKGSDAVDDWYYWSAALTPSSAYSLFNSSIYNGSFNGIISPFVPPYMDASQFTVAPRANGGKGEILLLHANTSGNGGWTTPDGSAYNHPVWVYDNSVITTPPTQKAGFGTAMRFQGLSSPRTYVKASGSGEFVPQEFVLDLWVYPTSAAVAADGNPIVYTTGNTLLNTPTWKYATYGIGLYNDGTFKFRALQSTTLQRIGGVWVDVPTYAEVSFGTAPLNTWTHLAVVRSGTTVSTYKDGVLANGSGTVTIAKPLNGMLFIGDFDGSVGKFTGYVDEVRLSNNVASFVPGTPPVSEWPTTFTPTKYTAFLFANREGLQQSGALKTHTSGGNTASATTTVYTGFKPKLLILKSLTNMTVTGLTKNLNWMVYDSIRNPVHTLMDTITYANLTNADVTCINTGATPSLCIGQGIELTSNGFIVYPRNAFSQGNPNGAQGEDVLYMAFADVPTKFSTAPSTGGSIPALTSPSGGLVTGPITQNTFYSLQCQAPGGMLPPKVVAITPPCLTATTGSAGSSCSSQCILKSSSATAPATVSWCCPAGPSAGTATDGSGVVSGFRSVGANGVYSLACPYGQASIVLGGGATITAPLRMYSTGGAGSASIIRVRKGSTVPLTWNVTGLSASDDCSISTVPSGVFSDTWDKAGTAWSHGASPKLTNPINTPTIITLSCTSSSGSVAPSRLDVRLIPAFKEI